MTKGRRVPKKQQHHLQNIDTLSQLLAFLNIAPDAWDLMIIGDGSGSGWGMGMGFAWTLIDRKSKARMSQGGGLTMGTITIGELAPCIYALDWYTSENGPGRSRQKKAMEHGTKLQAFVLSDNRGIVTAGNFPQSRSSHEELWLSVDAFRDRGFDIHFRHIPRDRVNIHILMDAFSRQCRINLKDSYQQSVNVLRETYPGLPEDLTVYDINC